MRGIFKLLNRFRADERGVFAVIFGLMAIVLVAMAGAVVDYTSLEAARAKAQIAFDSAALGLAPKIHDDTEEELRVQAQDLVVERLNDSSLTATVDVADATTATGTLELRGTLTVPMAFVQLVGISSMTTSIKSEATRGSINLEVAVALDTTGSMGPTGITQLQTALATLIPLVVKDDQTPTYSKMALVPFSTAVNVGAAYAAEARGSIIGSTAVTAADWKNGASKSITGITRNNPGVVTTSIDHGFSSGDYVYISGVVGMTQVNGKIYKVVPVTGQTKKFSLQNVSGGNVNTSGGSYSNYTSGGTVQRCYNATCDIAVTSAAHGHATSDYVVFTGVGGMTQLNFNKSTNSRIFQVTKLTNDMFIINSSPLGVWGGTTFSAYTSGGASFCMKYGCSYYRLGSSRTYVPTASCVTERSTNSFVDTAPSTTPLAIHYTDTGTCGSAAKMQPLTSDKSKLEAYTVTNALMPNGATAGHLGSAWAWYLVSPNFAELFDDPAATVGGDFESSPASYDAPNTLKIVIIMTDGLYNTEYCKGVNPTYSGCSAPNGTTGIMAGAMGQAEDLCYNMKEENVVVYTVGFNLPASGDELDMLQDCATDPSKAYSADSGDALNTAFRKIGENISDLRLSQ